MYIVKMRDDHKVLVLNSDTTTNDLLFIDQGITVAQCEKNQLIKPEVFAALPEQIQQIENYSGDWSLSSLPKGFRFALLHLGCVSKTKEPIKFISQELRDPTQRNPFTPDFTLKSLGRPKTLKNPLAKRELVFESPEKKAPDKKHPALTLFAGASVGGLKRKNNGDLSDPPAVKKSKLTQ